MLTFLLFGSLQQNVDRNSHAYTQLPQYRLHRGVLWRSSDFWLRHVHDMWISGCSGKSSTIRMSNLHTSGCSGPSWEVYRSKSLLPTMKPWPSLSGMSSTGCFILRWSCLKLPSTMMVRIYFWLQWYEMALKWKGNRLLWCLVNPGPWEINVGLWTCRTE